MLDARPLPPLAVADDKPIVARDIYETTDARALHRDEVHAQWALCIGAGVGAAAIVAALLWASALVTRADLWAWWPLPLIVGINVAGGGGVYVGFADHIRANRRWRKREQEHNLELDWHIAKHAAQMAVLVELCDQLKAERAALRNERDALRADYNRVSNELEATRYRNVAANTSSRHVPIQDTYSNAARADARELIRQWYAIAAWPGERTMQWTRGRHSTARDLMSRAGLLPNGTPTNAVPPPESEAWAIAKLDAYLGNTASTASTPHRGLEVGDAVDAPNAAGEG